MLCLDWNGTVVDDAPRAHQALLTVLGADSPAPATLHAFRQTFRLPLHIWLTDLGISRDRLAAAETRWNDEMRNHAAPLSQGARELLSWCAQHSVPVQVVTAAARQLVETDAARTGIRHLISEIIPGHPKEQPLRQKREHGYNVIFVGDTEYDLQQAERARVTSVAFTAGYRDAERLRTCNPAAAVDNLADIIPLLAAYLERNGGL
jgi:phosphoglycolate phosphatase-like HAD superfamily hydrolase